MTNANPEPVKRERVTKISVSLSPVLVARAHQRMNELGIINFSEYVRSVMRRDLVPISPEPKEESK